jgi:site-specific DNA-methyltransferase (adenine-specific)
VEVVEAFPENAGGGFGVQGAKVTGEIYARPGRKDAGKVVGHGDSGSAARFFYSAKADAEDRLGSKHPTVKPVDLMAWLCRLITPPGGTVLDPFAGTGTTGLAAMREGFDCILIEREAEYVADIERRLAWARGEGKLTAQEMGRKQEALAGPLFDAA